MTPADGREDARTEATALAGFTRLEIPDPARVDLQFRPRLAVGDRHRRRLAAEAELVHREAVQRRVGHFHTLTLQ